MYTINTTGSYRNPWGLFLGSQLVSSWPNYAAAARELARQGAHEADDHDATKCATCAATDPYMTENWGK